MTTLITGSTGFVGRRLVNTLHSQGRPVRAAVRAPDASLQVPQVVLPSPGTTIDDWRPLIKGCDTVIHLLARAHVMQDEASDPLAAFRLVNTEMTKACAAAAAAEGVRRFVFVSSIGVQGNATTVRPIEAQDPLAPHSPYAQSKAEAELALRQLAEAESMEWTIVRPPLVHGPNAPGNMHILMRVLHKRVPLPLAGVIHNRRSLVAVDNLVDLLIRCIDHPRAANQTFLVSDGEDLSTADLLQRLGNAMGRSPLMFRVPTSVLWAGARWMGRGDLAQRLLGNLQVNIDHTRQTLGWEPPISVDEGLRRAAKGFRP
ncbi:NAD-dependent epimerase/dehydratase family protein [Hydrogenophaga sp. R2]|uniref:NAD-dependent epimerase/dehydratase family protein n=1 Tax=Hydrogenophaga sp. R2 TaxID=3132827 RepID=UPI003CF47207